MDMEAVRNFLESAGHFGRRIARLLPNEAQPPPRPDSNRASQPR
ncbi:MAG: hypothetical protein ACJA0P_002611 [Planctomycetota bacterium]|jgi:hypothetical protein